MYILKTLKLNSVADKDTTGEGGGGTVPPPIISVQGVSKETQPLNILRYSYCS